MLSKPVLKSHWSIRNTGSCYLLLSEDDRYLLQDAIYDHLMPLLDGRNTVADMVHRLKGRVSAAAIRSALDSMARQGFLTESPARQWTPADAFWELAGSAASDVHCRVPTASAAVMASDTNVGESIGRALSLLDILVTSDAPFRIVAVADYLNSTLARLNSEALRLGSPWLMAKPYGRTHWLGPLFVPGRTACWMCLVQRLHQNGWTAASSLAALPTTSAATAAMIATEAAKWLLMGNNSRLEGQIRTFNTATLEIETHIVSRYPQCPACGNRSLATPKRLQVSRVPSFPDPEATLRTLARHVSPITGIISNLAKRCDASGLFVYTADQHQVARRDPSGAAMLTLPLGVAGKGSTDAQARASCLAEGVERYSVQFHGDEPRITACFDELAGRAQDPRILLLFSEAQYRQRGRWNARNPGFHQVPEPFQDNASIEWVKAWSLTRKRSCYVPAAYCYLGYSKSFCRADTNGCAAGPTLAQAVLHGLMELVERDAVALWWYNRARRPAVDLERFQSREITGIREYLRERDRSLYVLDITSDLGIPAFVAVSAKSNGKGILFGTAAHVDASVAVVHALCELQQCLCTFTRRAGRDFANPSERAVVRWMRSASLQNQRWLRPLSKVAKSGAAAGTSARAPIADHLPACIQAVERAGLEVLVLDMTRPEVGFPVARAIVPGLRHNWARLAPGRLYDIPVTLGWQRKRLKESGLNPIPYFL